MQHSTPLSQEQRGTTSKKAFERPPKLCQRNGRENKRSSQRTKRHSCPNQQDKKTPPNNGLYQRTEEILVVAIDCSVLAYVSRGRPRIICLTPKCKKKKTSAFYITKNNKLPASN